MISKERLEELVKKGATIYAVTLDDKVGFINFIDYEGKVLENALKFRVKIKPDLSNWYGCEPNWSEYISLKSLFEIKEEAEEYIKYGNITKTEKFPYVSWEELCKGAVIAFKDRYGLPYCCEVDNRFVFVYKLHLIKTWIFKERLTRENYHKALDLCVKLWKGEE